MNSFLLHLRRQRIAMALPLMAALLSMASCAQNHVSLQHEIAQSLQAPQRYPAGSIQSVETADDALKTVEQERAGVEERYVRDQQKCYGKFFMTACTDEAKDRHRIALAQLRPVEVEANAFKRRAKADERDKALAAKRAEEEADTSRPSQARKSEASGRRKDAEGKQAESGQAAGAASDSAGATPSSRAARHQAKTERSKADEAADAKKREENVAAYEKKVKEAEARQREIAERKAKKERERAEKNAAPPNPNP